MMITITTAAAMIDTLQRIISVSDLERPEDVKVLLIYDKERSRFYFANQDMNHRFMLNCIDFTQKPAEEEVPNAG